MTPTPPDAPPPPPKETEKKPLKGKVPEGRSIWFAGKKLKPGDKIPEALEKTLGKKPPTKKP